MIFFLLYHMSEWGGTSMILRFDKIFSRVETSTCYLQILGRRTALRDLTARPYILGVIPLMMALVCSGLWACNMCL